MLGRTKHSQGKHVNPCKTVHNLKARIAQLKTVLIIVMIPLKFLLIPSFDIKENYTSKLDQVPLLKIYKNKQYDYG